MANNVSRTHDGQMREKKKGKNPVLRSRKKKKEIDE